MEEIREEIAEIVENTKYAGYQEFKAKFDEEWSNNEKKATELIEGFARIGYLLKQARDTDILKDSEYENYIDFARSEYDIDKTVVSSYIRINDRFSENGNSEMLQEQYRDFGYAKLRLMLQLPDAINSELTPEYSKSEIQTIKEEYDEEKNITDIELLLEGQKPEQHVMDNLNKAMHQLCEDMPELYLLLHEAYLNGEEGKKSIYEVLAPDEEKMYSIRIQGVGRLLMTVKNEQVNLTNIRTEEKETYSWEEMIEAVKYLVVETLSAKENWEAIYNKPFPKAEVAPVQQKSEEKKPAKRKESKVVKTKPDKKPQVQQSPEEKSVPVQTQKEIVSEQNGTELQKNETVLVKNGTEEIENETVDEEESVESEAAPVEMENEIIPVSDEAEVQLDTETVGADSAEQMPNRAHQQQVLEKRKDEVKLNILSTLVKAKEAAGAEYWNTFKMHLADMKADAERIEKIDIEIRDLNDTSQARVEDFLDGEEKDETNL